MTKNRNPVHRRPGRARAIAAWQQTMAQARTAPPDDHVVNAAFIPAYLTLEKLENGTMENADFMNLLEMIVSALHLQRLVRSGGRRHGAATLLEISASSLKAANALSARYMAQGRFSATREELETLHKALSDFQGLASILPAGLLLQAVSMARDDAMKACGVAQ